MRPRVLLLAMLGAACSTEPPSIPPVMCREIPWGSGAGSRTIADTLRIVVHVDSLPGDTSGEVLVRVDPLASGHVVFASPPPPTAAAVSATFTLSGVYQGCFAEDPAALFVRTPVAPRAKVWLRIAADRTVTVRVETGEPGPRSTLLSEWIVVDPGASGRGGWRMGDGP